MKGFDAISIYKTLIGTKDKLEFSTELFKFLSNFKIQYSEIRKLINPQIRKKRVGHEKTSISMRNQHKNLFKKATTMNATYFLNRFKEIM